MGYKQEPCPLCGRDMTAIETYSGRGELYCGHCDLTIGGNDAKTPEELIALMDSSEHRRLKAENTELRRLVRDMHKALFSLNLDHCQACPREDACVFIHKSFDCDECAFERDMHKLGIEVDG